jgi:signal transduction histidine kinase
LTLTNRLLLFFLGTLTLVLVGFSTALYLLARLHLHRQAEERLEAALNTLVAAIDVEPDGVEWDPTERQLDLGRAGPVEWLVSDDRGRIVDRSGPLAAEEFFPQAVPGPRPADPRDWQENDWQFRRRWVQTPSSGTPPRPLPPARTKNERKHPALAVTVGVPLEPVQATLRQLAGVLAGLSLGIWLLALVVGRGVCRRAVRPVREMAAAASAMDAADRSRRLPEPATGDELQELSRSFNGLLDRLHESFERQRRFTGDASHQLRTPLTALLGQIEVALRRERSAEEYRQTLATVQRQAVHLRQIVEALLFLARADAEARLPELERLVLDDWLAEHLRSWSAHPRMADIRVEKVAGPPLRVEVQPLLLGELLDLLLDNACKYSPPGSPITLRLGRERGGVSLAVEDRGCGIAVADLPHLCEPFFRSAEARRRGVAGLGLGLAIARRLAEAFRGELTVTSQEGKGSRFVVWLPEPP